MKGFYDPDRYDASVGEMPGEIAFYVRLARAAHEAGHPALELACGTGRVSIPIARAGVRLVGLDRSAAMLGRAREKSADLPNARWVEGDMASFDLPERFGLVLIPVRSFHHLLTVEDQLSCLSCIRRHLVPGGRLALHIFNPDLVLMSQWMTSRKGTLRSLRPYRQPRSGNTVIPSESVEYHPAEQTLDATFVDEELNDEGAVLSRVYRAFTLRYTHRYEMEHLFARAGFAIESLQGDFEGGAFCDTSVEQVWVARRSA